VTSSHRLPELSKGYDGEAPARNRPRLHHAAPGNAIDRRRFRAVVDFLDFRIARYPWPVFNLADTAIVCGVIIFVLDAVVARDKLSGER